MSDLNSSFDFRLRKEVRRDTAKLHDGLTGAVYPLDGVGCAIADAARDPLKAGELVARVAGSCGAVPEQVERELRQMILLGLFEDTCVASRERLELIRKGEELASRVLEGSRFGCQNSGACCRGYVFGSIREEEKIRIEALDLHKALPRLGRSPLFVEAGTSLGRPTYRLGTVGEACVFLEDGPSCGLHRAFGAGAKPALCQLYPLAAIATIDGLKIYDRGECATFAVSARTGTLLEEDIPRIRALVNEEIYHPMAQLHGSWRCDYGLILTLARRLDQEAKSHSPLSALHTIGDVTRAFIVALTKCLGSRSARSGSRDSAFMPKRKVPPFRAGGCCQRTGGLAGDGDSGCGPGRTSCSTRRFRAAVQGSGLENPWLFPVKGLPATVGLRLVGRFLYGAVEPKNVSRPTPSAY
jgi:Fe-S-cluster containining protein